MSIISDYRGWYCRNFKEIYQEDSPHYVTFLTHVEEGKTAEIEAILATEPSIEMCVKEDALAKAASLGHIDIVKVLLPLVEDRNPMRTIKGGFYNQEMTLTALGHAIRNRHTEIVMLLIENATTPLCYVEGACTASSGVDHNAIALFFASHREFGPNLALLKTLLYKLSGSYTFNNATYLQIARFASKEEIQMLLRCGFSLDLEFLADVMIQTELDALVNPTQDLTKAIFVLNELAKNPTVRIPNYIPYITIPLLIEQFSRMGHTVKKRINPGSHWDGAEGFCAIEVAACEKLVTCLTHLGAPIDSSPFVKETKVHIDILADLKKTMDMRGIEKRYWLRKTVEYRNLSALIALIGDDIDVNAQDEESGWTALHLLFSQLHFENCHTRNSVDLMVGNSMIRMINVLIQAGAKPLKDKMGRTPLMCCHFERCIWPNELSPIADMYADFEAIYHDCNKYRYRLKMREICFYFTEESVEKLIDKGTHRLIQNFTKELWEYVAHTPTDKAKILPPPVSLDAASSFAPSTDAPTSTRTSEVEKKSIDPKPLDAASSQEDLLGLPPQPPRFSRNRQNPAHKRAPTDRSHSPVDIGGRVIKKHSPAAIDIAHQIKA